LEGTLHPRISLPGKERDVIPTLLLTNGRVLLALVGKVNKVPLRDRRGAYFGKALILGPYLTHKEQLLNIQIFCYDLVLGLFYWECGHPGASLYKKGIQLRFSCSVKLSN
jgi:hypothetical protein